MINQENGYFFTNRQKQNSYWFLQTVNNRLKARFFENRAIKAKIEKLQKEVQHNKISPFKAADMLLKQYEDLQ